MNRREFLSKVVLLPTTLLALGIEGSEAKVIKPQGKDIVVVRLRDYVEEDTAAYIRDNIVGYLKRCGVDVPVLVVDGDSDIEVLKVK